MKNKLYNIFPVFFQNIMVTAKGYINKKIRYGKYYNRQREFLKEFDKLSYEDKKKYQLTELNKLISYASEKSLFYKDFYGNNLSMTTSGKLNNLQDIKSLPILEKSVLKENLESIYTTSDVVSYTGGTTGKSMKVYFTKEDMQKRMALLDHFKSKVGFENMKMWRASFTGKEIVSLEKTVTNKPFRINKFNKQILFSSFHLNNDNFQNYIDALNKYKPMSIDGLYSSILDLAKYINYNNLKLDFKPVAIFPTAETLTASGREEIEKAFSSKVYNQYASSEGAPFITECKEGKLHIEQVSGIFEVLDNNEILVTSFTSFGTPLIRYRIGDSVKPDSSSHKCKCGVEGDLVLEITGRTSNYIINERKQKITEANAANFFKELPYIISGQIIKKDGNYIFNIVVGDKAAYQRNYNFLCNKIKTFIGGDKFSINLKSELLLEPSGKFMILKEIIKEGEI